METIKKSIEIYDAKISFVSLVDRPANRRSFLLTKSEDDPKTVTFSGQGRILDSASSQVAYVDKSETPEVHYVTGVAYEPNVADTDDTFMTEKEIEKMAHWFMKNGRMVDEQHSFDPNLSCQVVESWIATEDTTIGGQTVTKGTWVVKIEVADSDVWNKIQNGEITGFSIGGLAKYGTEEVDLENTEAVERSSVVENDNNREVTKKKEKIGLLASLASFLGLSDEASVLQKGAVADDFAKKIKCEGFWLAFNSLEMALKHYDYDAEQYVFADNPETVRDALAEFSAIVTQLLTEGNAVEITRAIADDASRERANGRMPIMKAGRKMSSARLNQLKTIQEAVNSLVSELDDADSEDDGNDGNDDQGSSDASANDEEEPISKSDTPSEADVAPTTIRKDESEMTNEEMNALSEMVAKAVKDALAPQDSQQLSPEDCVTVLTRDEIGKMIAEAIEKAVSTPPASTEKPDAPLSKSDVQGMINTAVSEVAKARGYATNLNDEGHVEKADADDSHFWDSIFA